MNTISHLATHFVVHGGAWWPHTDYYSRVSHLNFTRELLTERNARYTTRHFGCESCPPLKEDFYSPAMLKDYYLRLGIAE